MVLNKSGWQKNQEPARMADVDALSGPPDVVSSPAAVQMQAFASDRNLILKRDSK